jgi:rhomboid protease GluP
MSNIYNEPEPETPPSPVSTPQQVRVNLPVTRPLVTYILIGVTVFFYLLQLAGQYLFEIDAVLYLGAKVNELIAAGQVWRLFTPMLLHGSILHIGFNMYALFIFGTRLERFMGHARFLIMYLLCAFTGNVLSFVFSPSVSVGASTAIFGLLGAEGVFLYRNWKVFGPAARRDLNNLILLAVVNLVIGLSARFDNWGHLGGLIGGVIFGWLAGPLLKVEMDVTGYSLVDQHTLADSIRAALVVGAAFVILTIAVIVYRY